MKLYQWIDSFFDTEKKRHAWLGLLSSLYLLWQTVWLAIVCFSLVRIPDTEGLMGFYGTLDRFQSSLYVRVILRMMSLSSLSPLRLAEALLFMVPLSGWIFFIAFLLYTAGEKKKCIGRTILGFILLQCSVMIVTVVLGLHADSLKTALSILKGMAWISLAISAFQSVLLFSVLTQSAMNMA